MGKIVPGLRDREKTSGGPGVGRKKPIFFTNDLAII
jgi:hypothetical protein